MENWFIDRADRSSDHQGESARPNGFASGSASEAMDAGVEAQLRAGGVTFGAADAELLWAVADHGSVSGAAESLGRSRARALNRLEELEDAFGSLVERRRGGADGGGSRLAPDARTLLARFDRLRAAVSGTAAVPETVLDGRVVGRDGEVGTIETDAGTVRALLVDDAPAGGPPTAEAPPDVDPGAPTIERIEELEFVQSTDDEPHPTADGGRPGAEAESRTRTAPTDDARPTTATVDARLDALAERTAELSEAFETGDPAGDLHDRVDTIEAGLEVVAGDVRSVRSELASVEQRLAEIERFRANTPPRDDDQRPTAAPEMRDESPFEAPDSR